ncbi:MAG: hypothetical protein LUD47_00165 [Clostridia bacterium]|nr:hypothetical protein [Clostridia bacterium]
MTEGTVYRCPRCASYKLSAGTDGAFSCADCGSLCAEEGWSTVSVISPETDCKAFLRSAWISVASADIPAGVFKHNFRKVETAERIVALDTRRFSAAEPYTVKETYTEKEPYVVTETVTDEKTGEPRDIKTVKYRDVEKERTVVKFSERKEESAEGGIFSESEVILEDGSRPARPAELKKSLEASHPASFSAPKGHKLSRAALGEDALSEIERLHGENAGEDVRGGGGTLERSTRVCLVPVFRTEISYGDDTYVASGYAFGGGRTHIGKVSDKASADGRRTWRMERRMMYAATYLLAAAVVLAIVLGVAGAGLAVLLPSVLSFFTASAAVYACGGVLMARRRRESAEASRKPTEEQPDRPGLLNEKLSSLGLEPATAADVRARGR